MTPTGAERFEPLHTRLERHGDTIVVAAYGEIDLTSTDRLQAQLRGLLNGHRRLVLDLRELDFIDSSGLHCILEVDRASRAAGVEFQIVPGPPHVRRVFSLTKTDETLRFIQHI